MSRQATKKRKAAAKPVRVVLKPVGEFPNCCPPAGRAPDSETFKRGHGMAAGFMDAFGPEELKDALQGFLASIRENLRDRIKKNEDHLDRLHEAMEVAEAR